MQENWHDIPRVNRHIAWKYFLSFKRETRILAINLSRHEIESIIRSWKLIDIYDSIESENKLFLKSEDDSFITNGIRIIHNKKQFDNQYSGIIIKCKNGNDINKEILEKIIPGGVIIYFDNRINKIIKSIGDDNYFGKKHSFYYFPKKEKKLLVSKNGAKSFTNCMRYFTALNIGRAVSLKIFVKLSRLLPKVIFRSGGITWRIKDGLFESSNYLYEWISEKIGEKIKYTNIYIGWTKIIIQLINNKENIIGYAKIGDHNRANKAIIKEELIIKQLMRINEIRKFLPKIIFCGEWNDHIVQIQQFNPGKYQSIKDCKKERNEFLYSMSKCDRIEKRIEEWKYWEALNICINHSTYLKLKDKKDIIDILGENIHKWLKSSLVFHRIHGDFTPWNTAISKEGYVVIDWEASREEGLPFYDMVYYCISRKYGVRRNELSIIEIFKITNIIFEGYAKKELDHKKIFNMETNIWLVTIYIYLNWQYPQFEEDVNTNI